jgi:hypothetical protein
MQTSYALLMRASSTGMQHKYARAATRDTGGRGFASAGLCALQPLIN